MSRKNRVNIECLCCKKVFEVQAYQKKLRKYCSHHCFVKNVVVGNKFNLGRIPWDKGLKFPGGIGKRISTKVKKICPICKKHFLVKNYRKKIAKYCSYKCVWKSLEGKPAWNKGTIGVMVAWNKGKPMPKTTGEKNSNWKGGKIIHNRYVYIYDSKHPFCDKQKYVAEHRLVMEKHIGRYLKPEEVVHHIDKNTTNNEINNLILFKNSREHLKFHRQSASTTLTVPTSPAPILK